MKEQLLYEPDYPLPDNEEVESHKETQYTAAVRHQGTERERLQISVNLHRIFAGKHWNKNRLI